MEWKLLHENLGIADNSKVLSRSSIIFKHEKMEVKLSDTGKTTDHVLGSKQVLIDTAYKLEQMAREMKARVDKL